MIAIKRLQSIMWILVVAMGALAAYLISLRVATERNAVGHLVDKIRWTRSEIRYLEAEFGARASMRQLAAWNHNDLRLYVPAPGQYLADERSLAQLDRVTPAEGSYAPPPVMTAMATQTARPAPAEAAPTSAAPIALAAVEKPVREKAKAPVELASRDSEPPAFSLIKPASAAETRANPSRVRLMANAEAGFIKPAGEPDPSKRRAARLALLESRLLGGPGLSKPIEGKVR